jgi:hypothetical protein
MDRICITVPTRKRFSNIIRFTRSVFETAAEPKKIEIAFRIDDDDEESPLAIKKMFQKYGCLHIKSVSKPRIQEHSHMHNEAAELSPLCQIYGCFGDDIEFEPSEIPWDTQVRAAFANYPDRILMCGGNDGYNPDILTHFFLSYNWYKTVGYLVPSIFHADYADTFTSEVAKRLGRYERLNFMNRHHHPVVTGLGADQTMIEKVNRGNTQMTNVLFTSDKVQMMINGDVIKLRKFIEEYKG